MMSDNDAAALMMQNGDMENARKLLLRAEKERPDDPQTQFLLAMLDLAAGDYPAEIRRLRRILVRHPKAARVRLELGRAFFLARDYDNAERQFRFATAGGLEPGVQTNINRFLMQIRQLRRFTYNFAIAIAPDTNLNAGPAIDSVNLYGLPFQLSQSAQKTSGVGLSLDLGGQLALPVATNVKMVLSGQLHRSQYRDGMFDDMTLSAGAGPRIVLHRWDVSVQGFALRRWFGDRTYSDTIGAGVDATYYANARLGVQYGLSHQRIDYAVNPLQSGTGTTVSLGGFYTPNASTILKATIAQTRQGAEVPGYANRSTQFGVTVYHDFKGGFSASVQPSYTLTHYDGVLAAFGIARRDQLAAVQLTLLNRRLDYFGFTPRVILSFANNRSDIPLYTFKRARVEMGLTRIF
ncbi:surface lipoprotein assembly modifier [Sphingomonas sp. QA11]|uniref:surface lipoprotein assembly modifier n=1 Tax=Sphingomonas sp. QA11 TaxID=2950605 RepID=UPI0023499A4A|nr:surface lipoprotein assembly modifier [Sphingomonas sp. QA11]WCM25889.1 surface lipoprotein assembly modifier [Sphingomonas sp. QA11]